MNRLGEALARFVPEAMKPPIVATSFEDLQRIAREKGVKHFIAVQPLIDEDFENSGTVRFMTNYQFETQKGREVAFQERFQTLTTGTGDYHEAFTSAFSRTYLTANERAIALRKNLHHPARIVSGWMEYADMDEQPFIEFDYVDKNYLEDQIAVARSRNLEPFPLAQPTT